MRQSIAAVLAAAALTGAAAAQNLVWDQGPQFGSLSNSPWNNQTNGQNFADDVLFDSNAFIVNEIRIWNFTPNNGAVRVKILTDDGNSPQSANPLFLADVVPFDNQPDGLPGNGRVMRIAVPDLVFAQNTRYWVGVSGNANDIQQRTATGYNPPNQRGNSNLWQFSGTNYDAGNYAGVGAQVFQLYGREVPAPGAAVLIGLGGLAAARRRRA